MHPFEGQERPHEGTELLLHSEPWLPWLEHDFSLLTHFKADVIPQVRLVQSPGWMAERRAFQRNLPLSVLIGFLKC